MWMGRIRERRALTVALSAEDKQHPVENPVQRRGRVPDPWGDRAGADRLAVPRPAPSEIALESRLHRRLQARPCAQRAVSFLSAPAPPLGLLASWPRSWQALQSLQSLQPLQIIALTAPPKDRMPSGLRLALEHRDLVGIEVLDPKPVPHEVTLGPAHHPDRITDHLQRAAGRGRSSVLKRSSGCLSGDLSRHADARWGHGNGCTAEPWEREDTHGGTMGTGGGNGSGEH